jgi:hypothetical protein
MSFLARAPRFIVFGCLAFAAAACDRSPAQPSPVLPSSPPPLTTTYRFKAGETVEGIVWASSVLSGEDRSGAGCDHKACVQISVTAPAAGTLSAHLSWSDVANRLGLYISSGWFDAERLV